jgi:hypothetical protein
MTINQRSYYEKWVTIRPDPDVINATLVALEISTVTTAGRQVVALLDPYLNNGRPIYEGSKPTVEIQLSGVLDPSNPAASYLTLSSSSIYSSQGVITSCMVVTMQPGYAAQA